MKLFSKLYNQTLEWAGHRLAERYLAALSFMESSFFPIPPDVMLVPMTVQRPDLSLRFATITTLFSVIGGLFGYLIGYYAFEALTPLLHDWGYWERYQQVVVWFKNWGFWVVFIAGFSPLPYKLFTIAAGALSLALLPFLLASFIGRGARFYLVAQLTARFGPKVEPTIRKYIEWIGWATVGLLAIAVWYLRG
jgi:membrane protein YqaA with SNARE-associated domain